MQTNISLKRSFYFFTFAFVAFLITGVVLDSALAGVPSGSQRVITFVIVILPTITGTFLAGISFFRQPRNFLLSLVSILLNLLTAAFFIFLILFAG